MNLPLKATVFEVNDIFRKVIQSELSYLKSTVRPDMPVDDQGGMWKYQLLSHDLTMVINKTSVLLETDNDYSKMIKIVSKGGQAPIAVLTQVGRRSQSYVFLLTPRPGKASQASNDKWGQCSKE